MRVDYDHESSRWGLTDFVLTGVLFTIVGLAIITAEVAFNESDQLSGPWLLAVVGLPPVAELLYVAWVGRSKGRGLALDFRLRFEPGDIRLGVRLFALAIFGAAILVALWSLFGEPPTATATDLAQDSGDSLTVWIIVFAVLGATFVPVVEEVVFRGLLWSALEKRGHGQIFTLVVTSAIFSLFHFEPARSPILFMIGIAIGIGRLRTGRIGASIVAHVCINSLAMIGLLAEVA